MGRTLVRLGVLVLAAWCWLLLAGEVGWLDAAAVDPWIGPAGQAGAALVGAGLLLRLFQPVSRELRRGRCARCGRAIERGQTYCLDHLRLTVDETRERAREALLDGRGRRVRSSSS